MKIPIGMRKFYLVIYGLLLYAVTLIVLAKLGVVIDGYLAGGIGTGFIGIMASSVYGYSKEYKYTNRFGQQETVSEKEKHITK